MSKFPEALAVVSEQSQASNPETEVTDIGNYISSYTSQGCKCTIWRHLVNQRAVPKLSVCESVVSGHKETTFIF